MKTFIVYDLDSQMPVAVGEQVSAETARYCASGPLAFSTQIFWQKKLISNYLVNHNWGDVCEGVPSNENECAVLSALISIAFLAQAFAVLRPLVPAKPEPPFNGEPVIIEDDSVAGTA
jgi:hypothetical protein